MHLLQAQFGIGEEATPRDPREVVIYTVFVY